MLEVGENMRPSDHMFSNVVIKKALSSNNFRQLAQSKFLCKKENSNICMSMLYQFDFFQSRCQLSFLSEQSCIDCTFFFPVF